MSASTISPRRAFTSLALVVSALSVTACSGFSASGSSGESSPGPARGDDAGTPAPHAPIITGTPDKSELNEAFGVFVAPKGQPESAGTREHPLATIQAGIDLGKRLGKRVYVCTGTFQEALVLADSISIIGGLDCSGSEWRIGAAHTRIEAPTSPAVRAKNIVAATRLEGLDIVAPSATEPAGSSIGLLADHAAAVVIAGSQITAGDGANGVNGTEGVQLAQTGSINGAPTVVEGQCRNGDTCTFVAGNGWLKPAGAAGGTSSCAGAPGHIGLSGGNGGSGGLYSSVRPAGSGWVWHYYGESASFAPEYGQDRDRTAPKTGASGTPSSAIGSLSSEGYVVASSGVAGTDGAPGNGGFGGRGSAPTTDPGPVPTNDVWRGAGGPGGGGGGCPGLAGTAGTGGGASIALALIDSPVVIDGTQLVAGRGGAGGHGTFGSDPTAGGAAGTNAVADSAVAARSGQNGASPGISTNGSSGPSVGVMHSGAAPTLRGSAKITPGPSGAAIDERSHEAFGNTRTIPATPTGIRKDILAL